MKEKILDILQAKHQLSGGNCGIYLPNICSLLNVEYYQIKDIIVNTLDVVLTSDFDLKYDDDIISDEHAKQLQFIKSNISKYKNLW